MMALQGGMVFCWCGGMEVLSVCGRALCWFVHEKICTGQNIICTHQFWGEMTLLKSVLACEF